MLPVTSRTQDYWVRRFNRLSISISSPHFLRSVLRFVCILPARDSRDSYPDVIIRVGEVFHSSFTTAESVFDVASLDVLVGSSLLRGSDQSVVHRNLLVVVSH